MKKSISQVLLLFLLTQMFNFSIAHAEATYAAPDSPGSVYNMNLDWKYKKPGTSFPLEASMNSIDKNGKRFYEMEYDDTDWETVSIPHQVNADNSFASRGSDAGDGGQYRGHIFYRKHFTLPEDAQGKKVFLEFEGIFNCAYVWVNGQKVGYYEAIVAPFGFDLTDYVVAGQENIIALASNSASVRGTTSYSAETVPAEEWGSSYTLNDTKYGKGVNYQWNTHEFTTTQAGLVYNCNLYIKDTVYQTLPLYNNLKTKGNYIYADNFDIREKTARLNVKAEIRNESAQAKDITLEVNVVHHDREIEGDTNANKLAYTFSAAKNVAAATDAGITFQTVVKPEVYQEGANHDFLTTHETVDVTYIDASFYAEELNFWSTDDPYLYDVYTILKDSAGNVLDIQMITTGFRKIDYSIDGGLKINDKAVWLTGYAQRSANEWAAIGSPTDWLVGYDMKLLKESNSNFIRWMHHAPRVNTVRATDKFGVAIVAPAGDKEADVSSRQWSQRTEAMRDTMIRFRNSPSVIFWESGNHDVTVDHQAEMLDLKEDIDPYGGRFEGCRSISSTSHLEVSEYVGTMLNRHAGNALASMKALGKYMPVVETEYHREESPRRVWDDYSGPDYDYDNIYRTDGVKTAGYDVFDLTQEDFVRNDAAAYEEFYRDQVGGISGLNYYAAAAALCWTDSNQHSRSQGSENGRMSGRVDPVRIKKESFYAYQVMQSKKPDVHVVGHWSYEPMNDLPQGQGGNYYYPIKAESNSVMYKTGEYGRRDPLHKTVYVVGTSAYIARIDLLVDGVVAGTDSIADNSFIYAFPNIDVTSGDKVEAVAYNARGEELARHEIQRAGAPATVRLTPKVGPEGFLADGSDLMYFDVEVVDADGNVCPMNTYKISFTLTGDAKFMGGYNSGKFGDNSVIGKNYVYAECGINRVFVKAGRTDGNITLTALLENGATMPVSVTVPISAYPAEVVGGLTTYRQQEIEIGAVDIAIEQTVAPLKPIAAVLKFLKTQWSDFVYTAEIISPDRTYTLTLNGTELRLINEAWKPDSVTGVLAEARTVLDALKEIGADFTYTYGINPDGKLILTMYANDREIVLLEGQTTIGVDSEPQADLTNAEIYTENGELMVEITALLKYISGVSMSRDDVNKVQAIFYTAQ